jgi:hypothetical protein
VLRELKIPALVVEAGNDQADARPRIESPVEQLQLRRARREAGRSRGRHEDGEGRRSSWTQAAGVSQQCPQSISM